MLAGFLVGWFVYHWLYSEMDNINNSVNVNDSESDMFKVFALILINKR